jgi:hypothetical protein
MGFSIEFVCVGALFTFLSVIKRKDNTNQTANKRPFFSTFVSASCFHIVFRSTGFSDILDKERFKEGR